jgi:L-arabinonolactonase
MHDPETRPTGSLYRLDADLSSHRQIDGLVCSNALCWSPDGRTMDHADTFYQMVWAWDFEPACGEIANRRTFLEVPVLAGAPDGATAPLGSSGGSLWR